MKEISENQFIYCWKNKRSSLIGKTMRGDKKLLLFHVGCNIKSYRYICKSGRNNVVMSLQNDIKFVTCVRPNYVYVDCK